MSTFSRKGSLLLLSNNFCSSSRGSTRGGKKRKFKFKFFDFSPREEEEDLMFYFMINIMLQVSMNASNLHVFRSIIVQGVIC